MARILIVHRDAGARQMVEATLRPRHVVTAAADYETAVRVLRTQRPDAIIAGQEARNGEAILLLQHMKATVQKTPIIVLAGRGAGVHQQHAMRLGAKAFLEYPVDEDRLLAAVDGAMATRTGEAAIPPVTDEEAAANLTALEKRLNATMKCFAGRNLVYLQSFIGGGTRSRPRISLKCPLRKEYGLEPNVYYEFIRDVCCGEPGRCEAVQRFEASQNR